MFERLAGRPPILPVPELPKQSEWLSSQFGHRSSPPFFIFDERVLVLFKYSTRMRSPWGFTFAPDEQALLGARSLEHQPIVVAMVCGSDGIAQ